MFEAPHGAVCAALLPHVMATNLKALPKDNRYTETAHLLTGNSSASPEEGINWIKNLVEKLNIPRLSTYGITENDFPSIIEKALEASSMKANPASLPNDELTHILKMAL